MVRSEESIRVDTTDEGLMVLHKKRFLLLSFGVACVTCVQAAPNDDDRLQKETDEFIKHCVAYGKVAAPKGIQVALPYLTAANYANSHYRQHKLFEAVGAVALWELLKKSVSAATGLTQESLPCDPAAYKAGSKTKLAAKTVNNVTWFAYKAADLVGPMFLRGFIAGDLKEHAKRK